MEALLRGTLTVDGEGCVQAKTSGDPVTLVWPQGYTVKGDSKSFEVLDAGKNVVARSGSSLEVGGGGQCEQLHDVDGPHPLQRHPVLDQHPGPGPPARWRWR